MVFLRRHHLLAKFVANFWTVARRCLNQKADRYYANAVWICDKKDNIPGFYFRVFLLEGLVAKLEESDPQ